MTDALDRLKTALADRYAIEREIGVGGMATVYLAKDLKHERQVAVKVLDPELAQSLGADRFLREIKTAANLTHPHILPLFDSGEADGFLFYVMPYMKGESLRARITKEKQLPVEDAVQITREIADALAYAHREGVIHRDVKPANIMLEEGHAILADFGVAHAVSEAKDQRLTRTGTSLGTPAYMSPEQATGEQDLDGRSDQYALGCVLYEMLAGHPPFTGAQVEAVVRQHLTQDPPSVTQTRPAVNEEVSKVIIRSLAKSPADRFRTCGDMAAGLALTTAPPKGRSKLGRAKAMIYAATVILGFATVAVVASFWPEGGTDSTEEAAVESLPEYYMAVFPFTNLTGDPELDHLGSYAAYGITDGLSRVPDVRAVASTRVTQAIEAMGEGGSELEVAATLGVGIAISGAYRLLGGRLQFTAEITRVADGELVTAVDASGDAGFPEGAVNELRQRVSGALALSSVERLWGLAASRQTPSIDAFGAYMRGIEIFNSRDWSGSLPHFHRAYQLDSTFLEPLVVAMAAYSNMGQPAGLDSLVAFLEPRRDQMQPGLQLQLEQKVAKLAGDLEGELRAIRALSQDDPQTWGYSLANRALHAGRPAEALRALEDVPADSPLLTTWSPYWERLAHANHLTGRYGEALEAARQGQGFFPEVLSLRRLEILALIALDRLDEIGPLLNAVEVMEPEGGSSPGDVFRQVATDLARYGHSEESRRVAERAREWYLARDPDAYHRERARILILEDRPEDALSLFGPLFEQYPDNLAVHGLHGISLALTGDRDGAEAEARWLEEVDRPYLLGANTYWRAAILAHLDRKDEAVRVRRQAFQEGSSYFGAFADPNFMPLWGYEPYEQLIAPKG